MEIKEIAQLSAQFGFPILVAAFLLLRVEPKLDGIGKALNALALATQSLAERLPHSNAAEKMASDLQKASDA